MSVHDTDDPVFFDAAIDSITSQTVCPDEIVLVKDGCLGNGLERVVKKWKTRLKDKLNILAFEASKGLGEALRVGTAHCKCELVARMDADDISVPNRFEKQLAFLEMNPNIDVVGSWVGEFSKSPDEVIGLRATPVLPEDICRYASFRNPVNHPSVMLRKNALHTVGGYLPYPGFEDYYLWARLLMRGHKIANIPEVLVKQRISHQFFNRRGGWAYAKQELSFQRELLRMGFISRRVYFVNIVFRISVRCMPLSLRRQIYKGLRAKPTTRPCA
jgi:glycosyltransferase involved in cell wall biosynthesis